MSEIKRYDAENDGFDGVEMVEYKDGEYVKYGDIEHLLNTIAQQPLSGSEQSSSPKLCGNCGGREECNYYLNYPDTPCDSYEPA
jgi:hypothetical protein